MCLIGIMNTRFSCRPTSPHHFLVVSYSNCPPTPTLHNLKTRTPCVPYLCEQGSNIVSRLGSVCWRLVRCYFARSHLVCCMPYLGVFWWFLFIVVLSSLLQEPMQFKEGDIVSVFEGTHEGVRAHRSMQYIGKVVGFDTEKDMWKVVTQPLTPTAPNPALTLN